MSTTIRKPLCAAIIRLSIRRYLDGECTLQRLKSWLYDSALSDVDSLDAEATSVAYELDKIIHRHTRGEVTKAALDARLKELGRQQ